jgi:metal iron transporter
LYFLSELAIISTDLAEIIGGAISLNLLFNLNIVAGTVITAFDVFLILLLYRPNGTMRGVRWFEIGVSLLVAGIVVCFSIEMAKTPNIEGKEVMKGFIPSGVIFSADGIFAAVGILGATIMPHAIFLGSHVALPRVREFDRQYHPARIEKDRNGEESNWQPSLSAIRSTLSYSITELIISLSTFATFVNSAILIVAGAALYGSEDAKGEDLFTIHTLLSTTLAPAAGTVFALALLFSGQSSSIVATIVGQIICEGFINWKVRPWVRRGITRLIALIPCVIVASAIGKSGLSLALNISQVPVPRLWLTAGFFKHLVTLYFSTADLSHVVQKGYASCCASRVLGVNCCGNKWEGENLGACEYNRKWRGGGSGREIHQYGERVGSHSFGLVNLGFHHRIKRVSHRHALPKEITFYHLYYHRNKRAQ